MVSNDSRQPFRTHNAPRWIILATWIVVCTLLIGASPLGNATPVLADDDTSATVNPADQTTTDDVTTDEPTAAIVVEPSTETDSTSSPDDETPVKPETDIVEPIVDEVDEDETPTDTPDETAEVVAEEEPTTSEPAETTEDNTTTDTHELDDTETESVDTDDEESTPEETPAPAATLTYLPAQQPTCTLTAADDEIVSSGGYLDYTCTFQVDLDGAHLSPTEIHLDWRFKTTLHEGWSVQYLPPPTNVDPEPVWTDAQTDVAKFRHEAILTVGDETSFTDTETIAVGLRLHRAVCERTDPTIALNASVAVTAPDSALEIQQLAVDPLPTPLTPQLAPIPEPSLSFSGSLDFGTIPVDAYGVQQAPEPQTLTVTVSGLDQSCGEWNLVLKAKNLSADDGESLTASSLSIVSIDGATPSDGTCPLNDGCLIANLTAGPDAPAAISYSLGVSLVLPDQLYATTFNSTLTATLKEATPS